MSVCPRCNEERSRERPGEGVYSCVRCHTFFQGTTRPENPDKPNGDGQGENEQ